MRTIIIRECYCFSTCVTVYMYMFVCMCVHAMYVQRANPIGTYVQSGCISSLFIKRKRL